MTQPTQNDGFVQITATGGETQLDFDFTIYAGADISVLETNLLGEVSTLALGLDYTVPGASLGTPDGGTINLTVPAVAGHVFTLASDLTETRSSDFQPGGDFFESTLNRQLDRLTILAKQNRRDVDRAAKLPPDALASFVQLPIPVDGRAIMWDGDDGLMKNGPTASEIASAQSFAVAADLSADAALLSEGNAQAWAVTAQNAATGINMTKVRVASIGANINIASAPASIDSIVMVAGDRVLLKDQTAPAQNGLYQWNGAGVAMTRTGDGDTWDELVSKFVGVEEGTSTYLGGVSNADLVFVSTVNRGGTLGTTAVTFILYVTPIQDGAISTAAKIVDGIITYAKTAAAAIASASDIINSVANKWVNAVTLALFIKENSWQKIAVYNPTLAGEIQVTSVITDAGYDYMFVVDKLGFVTTAMRLFMQVSTDNGATWLSASSYKWAGLRNTSAALTAVGDGSSGTTTFDMMALPIGNAATDCVSGEITFFNPLGGSSFHKRIDWKMASSDAGDLKQNNMCGLYAAAVNINAARFYVASGGLKAQGSITVWRRKNG